MIEQPALRNFRLGGDRIKGGGTFTGLYQQMFIGV